MDHEGPCPICGKETENINNHVRMSGGIHGERSAYPAGYDKVSRTYDGDTQPAAPETAPVEAETTPNKTNDVTPSQIEKSHSGETEATESKPEKLVLSDDANDARTYQCGGCGGPVSYLGGCDDCGEALVWVGMSGVEA